MTDDLNIHRTYTSRNEAERLDISHNGTLTMKRVTDIEPGDFVVSETFCGAVAMIDSFGSDGYNGLLRIYVGNVGGLIRSRWDYLGVIEPVGR